MNPSQERRTGLALRQWIPSLVTLGVLACGLAALEATRMGDWDLALRLILLAALADGIDGPLARRLQVASPMGKQLDSLADIVAFGAAPAFLFSTFHAGAAEPVRFGIALLFAGAGAYRLARFHGQPEGNFFHGLPITAAGMLLAVTVAGPLAPNTLAAGIVAAMLAALMVSRHPFPSLARLRWKLLPALAAIALSVALWPGVDTLAIAIGAGLSVYVLWSLLRRQSNSSGADNTNNNEVRNMPDAARKPQQKQSYWAFLRAFLRDRKTIGAVAPTSRHVARRMAVLGDLNSARRVAEFGPGTGAITRELLAALPADGRLWAFEVHPPFVTHLCETIDDARLTVLAESAEAIGSVREREGDTGFDAIISSIPFSLIGPERTTEILRTVAQSLRNGGAFVALQYHPRFLAPLLRAEFTSVEREVYPWNIPPVTLLRAHTPRQAD